MDLDDVNYVGTSPDMMLKATEKLLAISRGEAEQDERDSLEFRRVFPMNHLLRERIDLDADNILRTTARRVAKQKSLKSLTVNHFDKYPVGLIMSPLSMPLEEINPMHIVEQNRRITQLGPGGLAEESITEEANNIHPSEFGFISAIEGPECMPAEMEVYTLGGWKRWDEVSENTVFAIKVEGNWRISHSVPHNWSKATRLVKQKYKGPMIGYIDNDIFFKYTPSHRIIKPNGSEVYAIDAVDTELRIPSNLTTHITLNEDKWFVEELELDVYCATVPNGMLFVRGSKDTRGFWTGNSERIGVDTRLAYGARVGSDGKIYQRFKNRRSGKYAWLSPDNLVGKTVALPD